MPSISQSVDIYELDTHLEPVANSLCLQIARRGFAPKGSVTIMLIILVMCPSVGAWAQRYVVTDLGTFGGDFSKAHGINNEGQITGYAKLSNGSTLRAFRWQNGVLTDLGALGATAHYSSFGRAINSTSVAGYSDTTTGSISRATLWQSGAIYDIGAPPGFPSTVGFGLSSFGHVTGWTYDSNWNLGPGFLWTPTSANGTTGTIISLGTSGGPRSRGFGVNSAGQVVGETTYVDGIYHAMLWQNGAITVLDNRPSMAYAINSIGQVVGFFETTDNQLQKSILWQNGQTFDLGATSAAYGINTQGQVVGCSFLWTPSVPNGTTGVLKNLNDLIPPTSGWTIGNIGSDECVAGINDSGQIAGTGRFNGQTRAFLLTINTDPDTTTPSTSAVLGGTLGSASWYVSPVSISLSATDSDGRGDVDKTYFNLDGGATQIYTAPFSVSGEGSHTLVYWSRDFAGNTESSKTIGPIRIDRTSPIVTTTATPASSKKSAKPITVNISGTISDSMSGIAATGTYSVNDNYGSPQLSGTFSVNANGAYSFALQLEGTLTKNATRVYSISMSAADIAGNLGTSSTSVTILGR